MNPINVRCKKCFSLKRFYQASGTKGFSIMKTISVCGAVNNVLNTVDQNGSLVLMPSKDQGASLRIQPDPLCPKIQQARDKGLLMWPDMTINPDGSFQHYLQFINY